MSRWTARNHARQRLRSAAAMPPPRGTRRVAAGAGSGAGREAAIDESIAGSGIALFLPRIGVVVVAADLPVARLVIADEPHAGDPLGALPEVQVRHQAADRRAVLERQGLAVGAGGHHR